MTITKAIIPVAGWGTRLLPITKVIEKCMLPIGNRPLVDYIVDDCLTAGITEIYFVVNRVHSQLEHYYSRNLQLEDYLKAHGKESLLPLLAVPEISFHYVVQPMNEKYGTSIPVAMAAEMVGDESVVVLMGDDFIFNPGGANQVEQLLAGVANGGSSLLGVQVPMDEVGRYGVFKMSQDNQFEGIVEKPAPEQAPSHLINVSKYVMNRHLLDLVMAHTRQKVTGEYLITEPISQYAAEGGFMTVVPAVGKYLDGGTLGGWLEANKVMAESQLGS